MGEAVIVKAVRTPIGKSGGLLRDWRAEALAAWVFRCLLQDTGLLPQLVEEVYLGNAVGGGGNVARLAWLVAGYPLEVPAVTVDRQCGSGLEAIIQGSRQIISGAATAVVAGGVESVTHAPLRAWNRGSASGGREEKLTFYSRPPFAPEYLGDPDMGVAAEEVARRYGITRQEQDEWAVQSHRRAEAAWQEGFLEQVVVPLPPSPTLERGRLCFEEAAVSMDQKTWIRRDEGLRRLTMRLAARAPAAFVTGGTVTAANSCGTNDGAAAVLLLERKRARELGYRQAFLVRGAAAAGVDPNLPGMGPVPAICRMLERAGVALEQVDLFEVNEPFAALLLACRQELQIPSERLNVWGGAIAFGHPYGATGAVLVSHLMAAMSSRQARLGVAAMGIAGGLGVALLLERVTW